MSKLYSLINLYLKENPVSSNDDYAKAIYVFKICGWDQDSIVFALQHFGITKNKFTS
jgi:hypothetical protein